MMPRIFAITAVKESVQLDKTGRGEIAFTVTNATAHPLRAQIRIKPQDNASREWFSLIGETERDLAPNATQQVTVQAGVPVGTPAGRYRFSIVAVDTNNPDENYTEGPAVAFEVQEKAPEKPFPWWIAAAVGGGLVVVGAILWWLLTPTMVEVPALVGKSQEDATTELGEVNLKPRILPEGVEGTFGEVVEQKPEAGTEVETDTEVALTFTVQVPKEVVTMPLQEAAKLLDQKGFKVSKAGSEPHDKIGRERVTRSKPEAGEFAKPGETVQLWVAVPGVKVPGVSRKDSIREASRKITRVGLRVKTTGPRGGVVTGTTPSVGTVVAKNSTVTIHLRAKFIKLRDKVLAVPSREKVPVLE